MNPWVDIDAEQGVLSFMMWHPGKVESLTGEEFTRPLHKRLYQLLRAGVDYTELGRHCADMLDVDGVPPDYQITDIYYAPSLAPRALVEAVAELKRLHALRELGEQVERWQRRAPGLSVQAAKRELAKIVQTGGRAG